MNAIVAAVGSGLLHVVLPALSTVIAGYVVQLLRAQLAKVHIQLTDQQAVAIQDLARQGILAAEEASHRSPMSSAAKQDVATRLVLEARPDLSIDEAHTAIDVQLQALRPTLLPRPVPVPSTPGTFGR